MDQDTMQGQQPDINGDASQQAGLSVGSRLRAARESKRLSIEDVAQHLCFTLTRVRNIENDNYDQIQAKAYALGYIRSYAKLVELPIEEIIHDFNNLDVWCQPSSRVRVNQSVITKERSISNHSIKWLGLGIGVLVIILAAVWWTGSHNKHPRQVSMATSQNPIALQPDFQDNVTGT